MKIQVAIMLFVIILWAFSLDGGVRYRRSRQRRLYLLENGWAKQYHRCAECKRSDVKLYRPCGEILRDARIKCAKHVPPKSWDWYVPLVETKCGMVWGYTSVRQNDFERWKQLDDTAVIPADMRQQIATDGVTG